MIYAWRKKTVFLLAVVPTVLVGLLSGEARAEPSTSVINHGWEIVWNSAEATLRHVESGKEALLFRDEKGETEEDGFVNHSMLSVVGTVVSYSTEWYSEGGAHPSYGMNYRTVDLSKLDPAKMGDDGIRGPAADLSELFGAKAVFRRLAGEPAVQAAIAGTFSEIGGEAHPAPKSLDALLKAADGGCRADMGKQLLSDFRFSFRLGGKIAVVQVGLSHGCEVMRGEFTRLGRLYFPIPENLAEDFERAARAGALEERPFQKPSYDCRKAGTPIEYAICSNAKLARLDVAMAARYGELRKKNPGDAGKTIKTAQRDWIKQRNKDCAGGNVDCLIESYETRLAAMK